MITKPQAETIDALFSNGFGCSDEPGLSFTAHSAFPDADAFSSAARRCIPALAAKGVLETIPGNETRYRCTKTTFSAYQEWAKKHGDL